MIRVRDATEADVDTYLSLMHELELDYPQVKFVYMTGHSDGTGEDGAVHIWNTIIRQYCIDNNKILFDFYDNANTNYDIVTRMSIIKTIFHL